MRRPVFLSFCYKDDVDRIQQIRNMGQVVDGQPILSPNDFEQIKRKGKIAIENWINEQLKNKQCLIVLVGEHTADRPWVQYEIKKAKSMGKPIFGIYIHNLKDLKGKYSKKGKNPFDVLFGANHNYLCYDPSHYEYEGLKDYNTIENNIELWIETAIKQNKYNYFF